jgi:hypothetical protein
VSEEGRAIVFRTPSANEAAAVRDALERAGIPNESQVAVPAEREEEAVRVIEALMSDAGIKPLDGEAPVEGPDDGVGFPCPNCEKTAMLGEPCPGCGFEVRAGLDPLPPLVSEHEPDARSFCPECRGPLTFEWGACKTCGTEVEPLEKGDRLCPELTHVLFRDTVGGFACQVCKTVWVSAP